MLSISHKFPLFSPKKPCEVYTVITISQIRKTEVRRLTCPSSMANVDVELDREVYLAPDNIFFTLGDLLWSR